MNERRAKEPKEQPAEVIILSLDEYLDGVGESSTLKGMFKHYTGLTGGPSEASKEDFETAFKAFKDLPADQLI